MAVAAATATSATSTTAASFTTPPHTLRCCPCSGSLLPAAAAAEVRWGNTATFSLKTVCFPAKKWRETGRWRREGMICSARYDYNRGNSEDASTLMEMSTLVDDLAKLNAMVNEANKGIGADVRNRVDFLFNRATLLKYSADRMVDRGGRVPVQLTATLKGLQREHASVENIVRLAREAGPVMPDTEESPSQNLKPLLKEVDKEVINDDLPPTRKVIVKEKEQPKASAFETLTRQSALQEEQSQAATSATENYVMSTPAAKSSSPLAAFRKEIERRVMEQLTGRTIPVSDDEVLSKEQARESAAENSNVSGLIQNLPLRGRMPRRRVSGALKEEVLLDDAVSPETDAAPETQSQTLDATQDASSLADTQPLETDPESLELDQLRRNLSDLEQQLANAKEGSDRAEIAEAQLQQVTEKLAATVPLDVHDQVVKLERESLTMARTRIAQVTAELKEKEAMLSAVKQEMMAEQENLVGKVRELSGELAKRVSVEEVEAAVNSAVRELEKELGNALERAEFMQQELKTNEKLLKQLQMEWDAERTSLRGQLADVKESLFDVQLEQAGDRAKLKDALEKMQEMEESLARLQLALEEAEEERITRERNVLASVRSLIADMVKSKRAQLESTTASVDRDTSDGAHADSTVAAQMKSVEEVLATMFSGEKAMALETFFVMMGVLIQQESERLEITNSLSGAFGGSSGLRHSKDRRSIRNVASSRGDVTKGTKSVITLYYESSWEYAYLHYSADGSEWTPLPGVCMLNGIFVNNMPLKVVDVEGSSLEFVLTDGRGSWDCAPSGGNYHIKNSGTFLLSSGIIEQKR